MTMSRVTLACISLSLTASIGHAIPITLDGVTTPIAANAQITKVPDQIASGTGEVVATGLVWKGGMRFDEGLTDSFIAWCFDLVHPVGLGETYDYDVVDKPFSNSYLLEGAEMRVSNLFNAHYDTLDSSDGVQAAAFQLAVWEVSNDDDYNIASGVFQAAGYGEDSDEIAAMAQKYLSGGANYTGPMSWRTIFLETREETGTQNLVTAVRSAATPPVPLPASGLFLLAGVTGLAGLRRRRAAHA